VVEGTVIRSHAGGYLVYVAELGGIVQASARGRIKKEGLSILTGDRVSLEEIDTELKTAVITIRLERFNELSRPPVANVDQVIIVQAVNRKEWNQLVLDRYIVHFQLELGSCQPVICLNKCDLATADEIAPLQKLYQDLGYCVLVVSAKTGHGIDDLFKALAGKVSAFAGQSGVGKSSLLNCLSPGLKVKVDERREFYGFGRQTTTASELYEIELPENIQIPADIADRHIQATALDKKACWIADTPGFNLAEFNKPEPAMVAWQFPEIIPLAEKCRFSNCQHLVEDGCQVLASLDKIDTKRYESYKIIMAESIESEAYRRSSSQKAEAKVKTVGGDAKGKQVPRLKRRYRVESRRSQVQELSNIDEEDTDDEDQNEENSSEE
jgi:ribosome biogenesis GTPase